MRSFFWDCDRCCYLTEPLLTGTRENANDSIRQHDHDRARDQGKTRSSRSSSTNWEISTRSGKRRKVGNQESSRQDDLATSDTEVSSEALTGRQELIDDYDDAAFEARKVIGAKGWMAIVQHPSRCQPQSLKFNGLTLIVASSFAEQEDLLEEPLSAIVDEEHELHDGAADLGEGLTMDGGIVNRLFQYQRTGNDDAYIFMRSSSQNVLTPPWAASWNDRSQW